MAIDEAGFYPGFKEVSDNIRNELSKSFSDFQVELVNYLRSAIAASSGMYVSCKQFGTQDDIDAAWNIYVSVRDLYEHVLQNIVV